MLSWVIAIYDGQSLSWQIAIDVLATMFGCQSDLALERDPERPPESLRLVYARPFTYIGDAVAHLEHLMFSDRQDVFALIAQENPNLDDLSLTEPERFHRPPDFGSDWDNPPGGLPCPVRRPPDFPTGTRTDSFRQSWPPSEADWTALLVACRPT